MDAVLAGLPDPRDAVVSWEIDLPFPDGRPPISLNDRGNHWATKAKKIELVKAITRNAVRAAAVPPLSHVHVELHYRPATNRFRDADNLVATLKPAIDALHQPDERSHWEPILPGDDPRYVTWSQPAFHPAVKGMGAATWLVLSSYEGATA
jgi:crossover junction endodeoxyribonuclease RusA